MTQNIMTALFDIKRITEIPIQLSTLRHRFSLKYTSFNLAVVPTDTCMCINLLAYLSLLSSIDQKQWSKAKL